MTQRLTQAIASAAVMSRDEVYEAVREQLAHNLRACVVLDLVYHMGLYLTEIAHLAQSNVCTWDNTILIGSLESWDLLWMPDEVERSMGELLAKQPGDYVIQNYKGQRCTTRSMRRWINPLIHALDRDPGIFGLCSLGHVGTKRSLVIESRKASREQTRLVYFVQRPDGAIKIGKTGNLKARLQTLQNQLNLPVTLLATAPGYTELEYKLHKLFAHANLCGEWFLPVTELRDYIDDLPANT